MKLIINAADVHSTIHDEKGTIIMDYAVTDYHLTFNIKKLIEAFGSLQGAIIALATGATIPSDCMEQPPC